MSAALSWTHTDESPALSSISLLPIMRHFVSAAQVDINVLDISLAGRILQEFSEYLLPDQVIEPGMKALSELVHQPHANVIKLPNASATLNQLQDAVQELRSKGFAIPEYPQQPKTQEERIIKARYNTQIGSVVNPPMRQGDAVRSIPELVKNAAREKPHGLGEWRSDSKTRIAHMTDGDFYATECSLNISEERAGKACIRFKSYDGNERIFKFDLHLNPDDLIDTAVMKRAALQNFLEQAIQESQQENLPLSLHLKATMMKKTDGVIFGDAVRQYFKPVFVKYGDVLDDIGFDPNNGLDDLLQKIETLKPALKTAIQDSIGACVDDGAELAMANLKDGSHHLSSPNNVIADVSLANLARWAGEVLDRNGKYRDTIAVLPDSTYARMHQAGIEFLKQNGSPDPKTLGSVTTVRLQTEEAEEYGSKDTTFEAPSAGVIELVSESGEVLNAQDVEKGDLWRLCRTTDRGANNWIDLAIETAIESDDPVIFWLDENRSHDRNLIALVKNKMAERNISNFEILAPEKAIVKTLERSYKGRNTICVTGNLVGDHITDYFPILEIGSSSKMLSTIKLLKGGMIAETGSGGTAPDLLSSVAEKNHFLWDDMGTAFAVSDMLQNISESCENIKAHIMAETLKLATARYIQDNRSPSPNGLDTRESHFYLTLYWAQELARQNKDEELRAEFTELKNNLESSTEVILSELQEARKQPGDTQGRYYPDPETVEQLMRPSSTLNSFIHS